MDGEKQGEWKLLKLLKLIPFSVPLAAAGEMYKMF